jgi:hypothetical protein
LLFLAFRIGANPAPAPIPDFPAPEKIPVKDLDALSDTASDTAAARPSGGAASPIGALPPSAAHGPDSPAQAGAGPAQVTPMISTSGSAGPAPAAAGVADGAASIPAASEKGIVLSAEDGKPVPQALVVLIGGRERFSCQSDKDGLYQLRGVPPGAYKLKVGKKGFALFERDSVAYVAGENPVREIRLERSVIKGQLIEAKGGSNAASAASMLAARRASSGVMEGVSAEQISKSTDADAGAVAKRVTGTSLVGGRYVYVRGLGERYTNMTLNGLPVPSPEKDKRVVPQDLFPAAALERFAIQKTFSPDLYSDFAGGSVALETRGIPEKPFFKISLGTGGTDFAGDPKFLNWGDPRLTYDGGNTYWGFDDGTRNLPKGFPTSIPGISDKDVPAYHAAGLHGYTTQERLQFALKLENVYALDTARILPYQNFSASFGDVKTAGEKRYGYLATAGFKNKYIQRDILKTTLITKPTGYDSTYHHPIIGDVTYHVVPTDTMPGFTGDTLDGRPVPNMRRLQILDTGTSALISSGDYEAVLSGMADFGFEDRDNKLFWKNFFVNIGTDEADRTRSKLFPGGRQDKQVEERYLLDFNQRSLFSTQVGGGHYIGTGPLDSVSWAAGYSRTQGNTPDSRRYKYSGETDSTVNEYENNDIWGTRIFEKLSENGLSARGDFHLVTPPERFPSDTLFTQGKGFSHLRLPEARAGLFATVRNRDFAAARFQYGANQQIQKNQTLEEIRDPVRLARDMLDPTHAQDFYSAPKRYDEYNADERISGGYLSVSFGWSFFHLPIGLDLGGRLENYRLHLRAPFTGQDFGTDLKKIADSAKVVDIDGNAFFPMAGLSIEPMGNARIRFIYGSTAIHPEFREIAPYGYNDYIKDRTVSGNTALKETRVRHLDARFDWFLPDKQLLSFSLFRKDFADPVEPVADNNHTETFQNAVSAYVRGAEMEILMDLESIGRAVGAGGFLKGWTLGGNAAVMHSRVELDSAQAKENTSLRRPMVGQSPYLINAALAQEGGSGDWAWTNSLAFNVAGERIRNVGITLVPDEYEQPFPSLDYLGRITVKKRDQFTFKIKNLLGSRKRVVAREYNDKLRYHTVPAGTIARVYKDVVREYTLEEYQEGASYEIGYALDF